MADLESVRKRPRDQEVEVLLPPAAAKRPCSTSSSSYDILDLLESDDENLPEDVSSLISSLQEELSETLPSPAAAELAREEGARAGLSSSDSAGEEVIRRLVEASDDELGIPAGLEEEEEVGREVGEISNYDVFWELEEEAANYYMLQSELFMA